MQEEYIKKIISMIVQDLRNNNQGVLVDLIKKAEYSMDLMDHDNWNGGIDYYKLVFHLKYSDYMHIVDLIETYKSTIKNSLDSFYCNESEIITSIEIVAKIDQYVDWAAISPKENKDSVLALINAEKEFLIKAGTGVIQIRDQKINNQYKSQHQYLVQILKQLGLVSVHKYNDLWDWYDDYNLKGMSTYQSRRAYIRDIFQPLINTIQNSEESALNLIQYELTGWKKVDDAVTRMKEVLVKANKTADYQSVGMYGRE